MTVHSQGLILATRLCVMIKFVTVMRRQECKPMMLKIQCCQKLTEMYLFLKATDPKSFTVNVV